MPKKHIYTHVRMENEQTNPMVSESEKYSFPFKSHRLVNHCPPDTPFLVKVRAIITKRKIFVKQADISFLVSKFRQLTVNSLKSCI